MRRNQTFHELLIPMLVEGVGATSYLELGTHMNETIGNVRCDRRIGVDMHRRAKADEILFYQMTTREFIEKHAASLAPFDVVFIDADHNALSVQRDFNGIWPHVSADGLILLHDTNPETVVDTHAGLCGDSWKYARVLHEAGYETCTLPYHPGLTLVRKRSAWGPQL